MALSTRVLEGAGCQGSAGGRDGDGEAEGVEGVDVPAQGALGAATVVVVVGSEVGEGGGGIGQQVPDHGQD